MRNMIFVIAALAIAACGSDSGTDTVSGPPVDRLYRTLATYNSVLLSDVHAVGEAGGVPARCGETRCDTVEPHPTLGFAPGVSGRSTARGLGDGTWTPQGEIGGLGIWEVTVPGEFPQIVYGAWLDHSFFSTVAIRLSGHAAIIGEAFGRIYYDVPLPVEGTASYDGAMVGKDAISAADYAGAARLEVDFTAASLDATFSDIADIATGERIADIVFPGVPLTPDSHTAAAFHLPSAPGTYTYFNARFYGPDKEEISGVFGKDTLIGAFGTKRK